MTLRATIRFVIFIRVTSQVLSSSLDRCPGESGMHDIGYRKGTECISFTKISSVSWWKKMEPIAALNELCRRRFKEGKRYGFLYGPEIQFNEEWRKNMVTIRCMGHFFITQAFDNDCTEYLFRGGNACYFKVFYRVKDIDELAIFRYFVIYFRHDFHGDGTDEPIRRFENSKHFRFFFKTKYPICPTYEMRSDGYHDADPECCLKDVLWDGKYHVACIHKPYKNCNYEKKEYCHYHEYDQKWYRYVVHIVWPPETPYGIACPADIPKEWKIECLPKCRGNWGPWSSPPSQENLRCDTVILERFRPAKERDSQCNKIASDCCVGRKIVHYNASCTDFAFNQTINLKRRGCKNGGTLGRDSHGHLMCKCTDRYDGIECERDVCEGKCKHGASCIPGKGKPQCICRKGFTGSDCGVVAKSCGNKGVCENGGTCDRSYLGGEEVAYCKCKEGYGGVTCERSVEKCTDSSCNSNGLCTENSEYGSIECTCYDGYEGETCEINKKLKGKTSRAMQPTVTNVFGLVIGLSLGFVLLTFCFGGAFIHRRKKRRRHGHGSEFSNVSSAASSFSTTVSKLFGWEKNRRRRSVAARTEKGHTRSLVKTGSRTVGTSKQSLPTSAGKQDKVTWK